MLYLNKKDYTKKFNKKYIKKEGYYMTNQLQQTELEQKDLLQNFESMKNKYEKISYMINAIIHYINEKSLIACPKCGLAETMLPEIENENMDVFLFCSECKHEIKEKDIDKKIFSFYDEFLENYYKEEQEKLRLQEEEKIKKDQELIEQSLLRSDALTTVIERVVNQAVEKALNSVLNRKED